MGKRFLEAIGINPYPSGGSSSSNIFDDDWSSSSSSSSSSENWNHGYDSYNDDSRDDNDDGYYVWVECEPGESGCVELDEEDIANGNIVIVDNDNRRLLSSR